MSEKFTIQLTNFVKHYYAVFFDTSIVIAYIDKPRKKEINKEIKSKTKEFKIPLLQRGQFSKDYWEQYGFRYLNMSKEDILMEDNNNIEIAYDDIVKVTLTPYRTKARNSREEPPIPGQIWIEEYNNKHHYNHPYLAEHPNIDKLRQLFDDKFVYRPY